MKKRPLLILGIVLIVAIGYRFYQDSNQAGLQHVTGQTMGTIVYNVKYIGAEKDLKNEIDAILIAFNQSQSTYIPDSEISRLNRQGVLTYESDYFYPVLNISEEVFRKTNGAYDPTVGALVRAWGFGPDKEIPDLDSVIIDSLRSLTGFSQVVFDKEKASLPTNFQLDFSAIAKGYAVDLIADLLEVNGYSDYLVEIGGEVRCRGKNEKGETWSLGIEDPLVDLREQKILTVVRLKDQSLATSGNYRNYYEKDGRIYAHIIDPRTGYNAQHNLLSASVFSSTCMNADAYATAFMVLGLGPSQQIIEQTDDLEAMLVYQAEDGALKSFVSEGLKPFIEMNRAN